ncbi:MAG: hypothetical protein RQ739_15185 [Desulfotignum sp.]|nr:hypothetical protein [Desulfotignum sp.]
MEQLPENSILPSVNTVQLSIASYAFGTRELMALLERNPLAGTQISKVLQCP